ncbi:MAG: F0F1 ATP synthase subunit B [Nitrospirae bacterium]|nr:F0F1 ATP synthase subunit B [Nitrospirota bacterium]
MLELNNWFFVQLINFLLLLVLLNYILFKPLLRLFKEREGRIKGALGDAKTMSGEKDDILSRINTRLFEARNQAKAVLAGFKKEGINIQKGLADTAQKEAAGMTAKAQSEINAEVKKARESLRKDVETISKQIVEKMVGA